VAEKLALQESLMESDTEKMALERALLACSEQLAAVLAEQNKATARKGGQDDQHNPTSWRLQCLSISSVSSCMASAAAGSPWQQQSR
jgi:hypothetical protein